MKKCFVVCPIGNEDSPQRKRSDTVLKHIIEPVCKDLDFEVIRVDQINSVDKIDNTIIEYLTKSDLVIADMTEHNPNAFYEIGYRHALEKPLIPIKEEETAIPFDLANLRTITYVTNDLDKVDAAKRRLRETIESFNIQEDDVPQVDESKRDNNMSVNIIPYLLNIQDSLGELKLLVNERNHEMVEQTIELAMGQIQKNTSNPEDKLMQMFFSQALEKPDKIESFMKLADKFK